MAEGSPCQFSEAAGSFNRVNVAAGVSSKVNSEAGYSAGFELSPAAFPSNESKTDLSQAALIRVAKSNVYRLEDAGLGYYIKHYNPDTWYESCKLLLRSPRHAVRIGLALQRAGIPTTRPVLAASRSKHFLRPWARQAVFISTELAAPSLTDVLRECRIARHEAKQLAYSLGKLWGKLLSNGFIHMDPNPDNFMILIRHKGGDGYEGYRKGGDGYEGYRLVEVVGGIDDRYADDEGHEGDKIGEEGKVDRSGKGTDNINFGGKEEWHNNRETTCAVIDLDGIYHAPRLMWWFWRKRTQKFLYRILIVTAENYGPPKADVYRQFLKGLLNGYGRPIAHLLKFLPTARRYAVNRWRKRINSVSKHQQELS
ncbi:hypothetical protein [Halorhodospira halochloris]|uniref:hypothetical protein n=1 Tax=Halorhodospira halochloris TaxID=1052 RepID=UPI001EE8387E|nr:hypothetical protein [Halorhodospira halochloris]MCG5549111.1 hypothetical protein [Halorhodospira halochloris]